MFMNFNLQSQRKVQSRQRHCIVFDEYFYEMCLVFSKSFWLLDKLFEKLSQVKLFCFCARQLWSGSNLLLYWKTKICFWNWEIITRERSNIIWALWVAQTVRVLSYGGGGLAKSPYDGWKGLIHTSQFLLLYLRYGICGRGFG